MKVVTRMPKHPAIGGKFEWKPDQCPACGYSLCDHIGGTRGVNDARFRCPQCSNTFAYGEIVSLGGPVFLRRQIDSDQAALMSWSRAWNRLIAFHADDDALLEAILAGKEVKTRWAVYVLRGFIADKLKSFMEAQ